jgi:hypothetical protein
MLRFSGPPHQYDTSWTTQHSCQVPFGHELQPSVVNG